jgi:predicted nucleic acid-binding Zn ribbon protein
MNGYYATDNRESSKKQKPESKDPDVEKQVRVS